MKTFIPWVGGKTALRPVLYRLFPHSIDRYVEVFGGSAALLFGRSPQKGVVEVYNDLNSDLVNLFLCVRDRPMAFCKEVGWLPVNGRVPFEVLRDFLSQKAPDNRFLQEELAICDECFPPAEAEELRKILRGKAELWDVKRAAAYYKIIRYSYGATVSSYGGRPVDISRGLGHIHTCSRRLKNVVVENLSFNIIGPKYDEKWTLLYFDPPYYKAENILGPGNTFCCRRCFLISRKHLELSPITMFPSPVNYIRAAGNTSPPVPILCGTMLAAGSTGSLSSPTMTRRNMPLPRR